MKLKFLCWLDRYILGEPVHPHEPDWDEKIVASWERRDDIDDMLQDTNCEMLCWLLALLGAIVLAVGLMR